jgi:phosphonate transport system substrate-binding protein
MRRFSYLCLSLSLLALSACERSAEQHYVPEFAAAPASSTLTTYIFGVFPVHNPTQTLAVYGPVVDYLNTHIKDAAFRLEASQNHDNFLQKVFAQHFDFALGNPYQTIEGEEQGYRIFAKMKDDDFRGLILLRKDSPVTTLADLRGQRISFPSPIALAAAMMPQEYMHNLGLEMDEYDSLYVGSQESSIMNVYLKQSAAGATYPLSWQLFQQEHPDIAAELKVQWFTATLPSNGLLVHPDVPQTLCAKVRELLLQLHEHETGREILARIPIRAFEAADHQTYQAVREFRQRFNQQVKKDQ